MESPNEKEINAILLPEEEIQTSTEIDSTVPSKFVTDPQRYLQDTLSKIDGFDMRWSSLVTSEPLLFEDIDYLRVRSYVIPTVTEEELEAYKRGELRELYATFENMLICNLKYYNRIMTYCTMIFAHYIRVDDEVIYDGMKNLDYEIEITPTKLWCAALSGVSSTAWELEYAWRVGTKNITVQPIAGSDKSVFEVSWKRLYKNKTFARFMELCAFRCGTSGFRQTILADITPNRKLSQVCQKFTKASVAISDQQLETIWDYVEEQNIVQKALYVSLEAALRKMFGGDDSAFCVYVFVNEIFIHTAKFSMAFRKDDKGKISKIYLANSWECCLAETYLAETIKEQINWAKYELPLKYTYDKQTLVSLLTNMIQQDFRTVICLKRMNDYGIISRVWFTGTFDNVIIHEDLMKDNQVIKTSQKTLSKPNAAKWLVERGYVVFGIREDVYRFVAEQNFNRQTLIQHYSNYAVPVLKYMFDVITMHVKSKNEIIDILMAGDIPENKLNNENIKYTSVIKLEARQMMNKMLLQQNSGQKKKSYWKVISDD